MDAHLGRVDKAHPAMDCGELDEAEKAFGGLAGRQVQGQRQSICVRQDVNLGRDPATGPAQGIQISPPFLALALCWCAPSRACKHALPGNGITVLSIIWTARSPAPLATSAAMISS